MSIKNFIEYQRREFCKNKKCSTQIKLDKLKEKTKDYEKVRKTCQTNCLFTTWQFHHWLIEKGYLIIRPVKRKVNEF